MELNATRMRQFHKARGNRNGRLVRLVEMVELASEWGLGLIDTI